MASTSSSSGRSRLRTALRSALEGAALTIAAAVPLGWMLDRALVGPALAGLGLAWAASSVSVALLVYARAAPFERFLRAFGAGVALRAAVLAGIMIAFWGEDRAVQSAALASFALGVLVLLLLEYRQLMRK